MVKLLKVVTVAPVCKMPCVLVTCVLCVVMAPPHNVKERGSQPINGFLDHLILMVIST